MELGTEAWFDAARQAVNASDAYRDRGAGWRWPLGVGFLDDADEGHARYGVLDLHDGECRAAGTTDRAGFEAAPFRLAAGYPQWYRLLRGRVDVMRCVLLGDVAMQGDRLTALRYLPAATSMLDAIGTVEVDVPVAFGPL